MSTAYYSRYRGFSSNTPYRLIYITVGNAEEARKIGCALVEERLAACVNYNPIQSVFRWEGKVEEESEVAMLVKTRTNLVDRIIERVKELHSYEVPCILALPIAQGNPAFLEWVDESTV